MCTLKAVVLVGVIAAVCHSAMVSDSKCNGFFNWSKASPNGYITGIITFKNNLSGECRLEVKTSIPSATSKNLRISRLTPEHEISTGKDIEYEVRFPFDGTPPQVTKILFQDKTYCTDVPLKDEGKGVTELTATDFLATHMDTKVFRTSAHASSVSFRLF